MSYSASVLPEPRLSTRPMDLSHFIWVMGFGPELGFCTSPNEDGQTPKVNGYVNADGSPGSLSRALHSTRNVGGLWGTSGAPFPSAVLTSTSTNIQLRQITNFRAGK